jgi:hypothetical protein
MDDKKRFLKLWKENNDLLAISKKMRITKEYALTLLFDCVLNKGDKNE